MVEDTLPGAEAGKRAGAEVVIIRREHNDTMDFRGFNVVDSLSLASLGFVVRS